MLLRGPRRALVFHGRAVICLSGKNQGLLGYRSQIAQPLRTIPETSRSPIFCAPYSVATAGGFTPGGVAPKVVTTGVAGVAKGGNPNHSGFSKSQPSTDFAAL